MKGFLQFIKTTLIGGLLVILPIALLVMLVKQGVAIIDPLLQPVISRLPSDIPFPGIVALVIEIMVVLLACFLVGLVFRTQMGQGITRAIESRVLNKLPGYKLLRSLTRGALGEEETVHLKTALVEMEGGLVLSFIIEEHPDGRYTVFVPSAPAPTSGSVYIFPRESVHIVDVPFSQAVNCITKLGIGSGVLLERMK